MYDHINFSFLFKAVKAFNVELRGLADLRNDPQYKSVKTNKMLTLANTTHVHAETKRVQ